MSIVPFYWGGSVKSCFFRGVQFCHKSSDFWCLSGFCCFWVLVVMNNCLISDTPSQHWHCKMEWMSKQYPRCWATTMRVSPFAPTPTPHGRCSKRPRRKWAASWHRFDKSHRQAEHRKGYDFLSGALWRFPHISLCGSRFGADRCFKMVFFEKRRRKLSST